MASEALYSPIVALPNSDKYTSEETNIDAENIAGLPTPCAACLDAPKHHSSLRDAVGDDYLAAVDPLELWPQGTTIHVWYIDGYQAARDKVTKYAVEWSKYANINFKFDQKLPGDAKDSIRIKFNDPTQGHKSLFGKDSRLDLDPQWVKHFEKKIDPRFKPRNVWPSMYLDFGAMILEQELERPIRAITLHEFGHALGMVHEHLRPDLSLILKSRPEIEAFYLSHNKTWTKDTVKQTVHDKLAANAVKMSSTPDTTSIMMYQVPKEIMAPGQKEICYNYELSVTDKSFIRQTYPGRAVVP